MLSRLRSWARHLPAISISRARRCRSMSRRKPRQPSAPCSIIANSSGAPNWSATPKSDAQGRVYLPVYDDAEPSFDPPKLALPPLTPLKLGQSGDRKILYYRNPMGLADTSPAPKKDSMGMDYIAVYDGDEPNDGKTIKVSLDRVQRSGVRTETVESRVLDGRSVPSAPWRSTSAAPRS